MLRILSVSPSSPAAKAGIQKDESLISINGEPVIDEIDYQDLILHPHLEIEIADAGGNIRQVSVAKSSWEALGLQLDETVAAEAGDEQQDTADCRKPRSLLRQGKQVD